MIKAIIFDCFGVLTSSSWKEFWSSLPSAEQQNGARELNREYDASEITRDEFLTKIKQLTGHSPNDVEEVLFGHSEQKNVQLLEYIRVLKPKYKISILSNVASNWITDELLTKQEQALFDDMIFSYKIGLTKPDPRVFKMAANNLKVEPNECVLVDDIDRYCEAAQKLGIKAVLYQNFTQMKGDLERLLANQ